MDTPFRASRLKIERAAQHLAELEQAVADFMATNPITVTGKYEHGFYMFFSKVDRDFPRNFPGILGDAVHNLRVSLDLLASELVRMNKQDDSNTHFPFAESAAELENAIKRYRLDRLAPEVLDLVRQLKPYKGGSKALRGVHDLDIMDKHRTLIPGFGMVRVGAIAAGGHIDRIRAGHLISGFGLPEETVKQNDLKEGQTFSCTLEVTFASNTPFKHQQVIPTLHGLVKEFSGVVDAFESLVLGTVSKQLPGS